MRWNLVLPPRSALIVAVTAPTAFGQGIAAHWLAIFPGNGEQFKYSGTATIALLLGVASAWAINTVVDVQQRLRRVSVLAAEQAGDYVLSLCFRAIEQRRFVTVFLTNRTVYLGYVTVSPTLKPESQLVMTIAAEGYLHKDTLELQWTSAHLAAWQSDQQQAEKYRVVIPAKSIENAHFFNEDLDKAKPRPIDTPA